MGFIWSSKLASVFRLSGLLVIDSALDAAIKKVCKQHELIASVWYDKNIIFVTKANLRTPYSQTSSFMVSRSF